MARSGSFVVGVDGGNSKTDLVLAGTDGSLLAAVHGPSVSHQAVGLEIGMARLAELAARAWDRAGLVAGDTARVGVFCLAGADTPTDLRLLGRSLRRLGLAQRDLLRNDTLAALRSGTDRGWGVAVICGAGVNAAGVAPDGRTARLAGLGDISGDWGGGEGLGSAALAAAVRGRDGRGPRTTLERLVPEAFGLSRPASVTDALYAGRLDPRRLLDLSPLVFRAAFEGDTVARSIADRLADEVVAMATAIVRRLRLTRRDPDVVLAGGVMQTDDAIFHHRIRDGIAAVGPRARVIVPSVKPVVGAALLALDASDDAGDAERGGAAARLRAAFGVRG